MPTSPVPRPPCCRLAAAGAWLLVAGSAWAQTGPGPYYLALAETLSHESNILRLPDGVAPASGHARSDSVAMSSLLAGIDQGIGRQRLRGDLSLRTSHFARNDQLSNQGWGLNLALDWATVNQLSGNLSARLDRQLVRFDNNLDGSLVARNLADSRLVEALLRYGLPARLALEAGWSQSAVRYSDPSFANREYVEDSRSLGLRHAPGASLSYSLGLRQVDGRYPHFAQLGDGSELSDRYHGRYADAGLRWQAAPHELEARLSLGRNRFDRASATDTSGLSGHLRWRWQATGKLTLDTRLARERGQDSTALGFVLTPEGTPSGRFADTSRTTRTLAASLAYQWSAKLSAQLGVSDAHRDLRDSRLDAQGQLSTLSGADRNLQWSLGARWQATRGLVAGCDLGHERRSTASALSSKLSNTARSCFAQLALSR